MKIIQAVAITELLIGLTTLLASFVSWALALYNKPFAITLFVVSASLVSASLGIGLLRLKMWARNLVIFFAGYVILTKILSLSGIIVLSGALETALPAGLKNSISIMYHAFLIIFFTRHAVKDKFK